MINYLLHGNENKSPMKYEDRIVRTTGRYCFCVRLRRMLVCPSVIGLWFCCSITQSGPVQSNALEFKDNYSAASNNMKLVHWPLMGGLLYFVQRDLWK